MSLGKYFEILACRVKIDNKWGQGFKIIKKL